MLEIILSNLRDILPPQSLSVDGIANLVLIGTNYPSLLILTLISFSCSGEGGGWPGVGVGFCLRM